MPHFILAVNASKTSCLRLKLKGMAPILSELAEMSRLSSSTAFEVNALGLVMERRYSSTERDKCMPSWKPS